MTHRLTGPPVPGAGTTSVEGHPEGHPEAGPARRRPGGGRRGAALLGMATLLAAGCSAGVRVNPPTSTAPDPSWSPTACGTYSGKGCAPDSKRVDRAKPAFSNPTKITNPLFPISTLQSVVLLGKADGAPFRSETTLLPGTRTVEWDGKRIETVVSQYTAYRNGLIEEVAIDLYGQADDGSVWYFGEDVVDYRDGTVFTLAGTWHAGKEGPPAMIMPARPEVGHVFRSENVLGVVFEELEVTEVGKTVQGPHGPVTGAVVTQELHLDGTKAEKVFAPGYGEFSTGHGDSLEAVAVAVPVGALPSPPPAQIALLTTGATGMLGALQTGDREAAASILDRMTADWGRFTKAGQPAVITAKVSGSLKALATAVRTRKAGPAGQAAIDVAQSVTDLKLRYRPPAEIDRDRFELWLHQVLVHAAGRDGAGVSGDVATLEWIRDRISHTLEPAGADEVTVRLRALRGAADAGRLSAAADHAALLIGRLRSLAGR